MPKEKMISFKEHERIRIALQDEIIRKDKVIEKLKAENIVLLKIALKRANGLEEMRKRR